MKFLITLTACAALLVGCSTDKPVATNNALDFQNLTGVEFTPMDSTVGVWPSQSALYDPSNPFAGYAIYDANKWDICNHKSLSKIDGYYCWSTALAQRNSHDNQFYAANLAYEIYKTLPDSNQNKQVARSIAMHGFRQLFENFPNEGPGINPDDQTASSQTGVTKGELYVGTRDCGWHYTLTAFNALDSLDTDYYLYTKTFNDGTVLDSLDSNTVMKPYCISYIQDTENQCGISSWETGSTIAPDFQRWLPVIVKSDPRYGGCGTLDPTVTTRANAKFKTKYWDKNKEESGWSLVRKVPVEEYDSLSTNNLLNTLLH